MARTSSTVGGSASQSETYVAESPRQTPGGVPRRYSPATAALAFDRVMAGTDPRVALGDFLDDWNRTPASRRATLVRESIRQQGADPDLRRWAAFFAATVDQLCAEEGRPAPAWVRDTKYRLHEPWFLIEGWPLRAWLLVSTPVPFKMRNIFGGENLLDRA